MLRQRKSRCKLRVMPWPDVQMNHVLEQEDLRKNIAPEISIKEKSDAGAQMPVASNSVHRKKGEDGTLSQFEQQ